MTPAPRVGPLRVVLMRHAEKTGDPTDPTLSTQGAWRADALVRTIPLQLGRIDFVIAAKSTTKSARPYLTVEPFARLEGLSIDERWNTRDIDAMAVAVLSDPAYSGRTGLICWRHDTLQQLAQALGAREAPPWAEDVYDRFWILTYRPDGADFSDVAQTV